MGNKKGITLIALVVTIVVMLILSGIRIVMEVNDQGVISKAEKVKDETERQETLENIEKLLFFDNSNTIDEEKTLNKIRELYVDAEITEEEGKRYILANGYKLEIDNNKILNIILNDLPVSAAYAILTTDGTLYFTRSDDYEINEENGKLRSNKSGEEITKYKFKNIEKAFIVDENKNYNHQYVPEWLECSSKVKSVKFDKIIMPISTYNWFSNMNNCTTIDIINLNTKNNKNMNGMFSNCSKLTKIKGLTKLNTSNVTNMGYIFNKCNLIKGLDLLDWDTKSVEDMSHMFSNCSNLKKIDLSTWSVNNVKSMNSMFEKCNSLQEIKGLENWETEKLTSMYSMFQNCSSLKELNGIKGFDVSKVTMMFNLFDGCSLIKKLNLSEWKTSGVTNFQCLFRNCSSLINIVGIESLKTEKMTSASQMFSGCKSLTNLDLSNWSNVSGIKDLDSMFNDCISLTEVKGMSEWELTAATKMSSMFNNCKSLISLDLSKWKKDDASKIERIDKMFSGCSSLKEIIGIKEWDLTNIISNLNNGSEKYGLNMIFYNCESLTSLDLSGWKIRNVQYLTMMFSGCKSLIEIKGISGWDTSTVTNTNLMFAGCELLKDIGDLSGWDTSMVTDMSHMFINCESLINLDLSGWKTENVTNMNHMFAGCINLTVDCKNWNVDNVEDYVDFDYNAPGVILPLDWQTTES